MAQSIKSLKLPSFEAKAHERSLITLNWYRKRQTSTVGLAISATRKRPFAEESAGIAIKTIQEASTGSAFSFGTIERVYLDRGSSISNLSSHDEVMHERTKGRAHYFSNILAKRIVADIRKDELINMERN